MSATEGKDDRPSAAEFSRVLTEVTADETSSCKDIFVKEYPQLAFFLKGSTKEDIDVSLDSILNFLSKSLKQSGDTGVEEKCCMIVEGLATYEGENIKSVIKKSESGIVDLLTDRAHHGKTSKVKVSSRRALQALHVCFDGTLVA
jgi:mevalonate kinase